MRKLIQLAVAIFLVIAIFYPFIKEEKAEEPTDITLDERPDFSSITDVSQKKAAFFDYMRTGVQVENERIENERNQLSAMQKLISFRSFTEEQIQFIGRISERYKVDLPETEITSDWFDQALIKVNVLPEALVLTQAANESAWGTSRFAVEANNYFGQWCYSKGCGLVPLKRSEGATHEVAKFPSVNASVHAYFMNVNRNNAYRELRQIRADLVKDGSSLLDTNAAIKLTQGLLRYSERGQDYVDDLQAMIRVNKKYWTTQ
ncbi:glucosaminidase domain-containing protein [Vibrio sp. HN007]|uniref:glucosaminidase domain-containing protein n=1 Tax=Vibrio iocasae TaxID=3098914 RepID=UPI0035D4F251